jgi:hypothetical protein
VPGPPLGRFDARRMAEMIRNMDCYRPAAEAMVVELWPRIERMADELLERGRLDAEDARRLSQRRRVVPVSAPRISSWNRVAAGVLVSACCERARLRSARTARPLPPAAVVGTRVPAAPHPSPMAQSRTTACGTSLTDTLTAAAAVDLESKGTCNGGLRCSCAGARF